MSVICTCLFASLDSLNPGNILATNLGRSVKDVLGVVRKRVMWLGASESMKSLAQGAATTLFCAAAPADALENGAFYWFFAPTASFAPRNADDRELARRLWEVSEEMLAPHFQE